jgi:hypothetical protein
MQSYKPRKLLFKAWNRETKLVMRLDSIACSRGELVRENHILLQYTGVNDKQGEELYDMDIVLIDSARFIIQWCEERCGWCYGMMKENASRDMLSRETAGRMLRLCSFFESGSV